MGVAILVSTSSKKSRQPREPERASTFDTEASSAKARVGNSVQRLLPDNYEGPVVRIDFVDDADNPQSLDYVYICPVSNAESRGGTYFLNGARSLIVAYVDRPAKQRELRAGIPYYALRKVVAGGKGKVQRVDFALPALKQETEEYKLKLTFTSPTDQNLPRPSAFQIEGIAPDVDTPEEILHVSYYLEGQESKRLGECQPGKAFKFGVDVLGGDLVFSDPNIRVIFGVEVSVGNANLGKVRPILGHRKYRYSRSLAGDVELAEFFPENQQNIPTALAVVPGGQQEIEFAAPPGRYRMRVSTKSNYKDRKSLPMIDVELGEAPYFLRK